MGNMLSKILIIPMSAMAETSGPSTRCRLLADGFKSAGLDVATCMAADVNFKKLDGIQNYFLDIPMPFGLPAPIASRTFPIAQKLGITSRKQVDSFDQVLFMTGNLDYKYLKKSMLFLHMLNTPLCDKYNNRLKARDCQIQAPGL